MTPQQVAAIIRGRLGGRLSQTQLDGYILQELNSAQDQLEDGPTLPWFLVKTALLQVNSQGVAFLPFDFIVEDEWQSQFWADAVSTTVGVVSLPGGPASAPTAYTSWVSLDKKPLTELNVVGMAGEAKYYSIQGGSVVIRPVPTAQGNSRLVWNYKARQAQLTSLNDSNLWYTHAPHCLLNLAGSKLAGSYVKDPELKAEFENGLRTAMSQLNSKNIARESANFDAGSMTLHQGT